MKRGLAKKIMDESFELETDGVNLYVKPADRLTGSLRRFIRKHKVEIISELLAANEGACETSDSDHILVECWSPDGDRILVWAHNPAHADWLRKMNPPRQLTNPETTIVCATPIAAIQAWLDQIEETDEAVRKEVMERAVLGSILVPWSAICGVLNRVLLTCRHDEKRTGSKSSRRRKNGNQKSRPTGRLFLNH